MAAIESFPVPQPKPPQSRHLGKYVDPCTYIFGALGIVRAGSQHAVGPGVEAFLIGQVKLGGGDSKALQIATDIVQRDQAMEAVEGGVFQTLRHYRAGELRSEER